MFQRLICGFLFGGLSGILCGVIGFALYMAATRWSDYAQLVMFFGAVVGALLGSSAGLVIGFLTYTPPRQNRSPTSRGDALSR